MNINPENKFMALIVFYDNTPSPFWKWTSLKANPSTHCSFSQFDFFFFKISIIIISRNRLVMDQNKQKSLSASFCQLIDISEGILIIGKFHFQTGGKWVITEFNWINWKTITTFQSLNKLRFCLIEDLPFSKSPTVICTCQDRNQMCHQTNCTTISL